MKSYWIVCILNNWVNDSKVSIWTRSEHLNATRSTVGSSQLDSDGWRVSRHTSGRAPEAKPWTNERPDIFARASWARRGTQRGSGACARFSTVNRCLSVMRCPRPSCAGKRWPTSAAFSRFWPKFVGLRRPPPPCVVGCVSGVRRSDRRFCVYVCVCGACDTDKRPRRVRVTRMLPGKEDSREKTHFIVSFFPRTPVLSPRNTKLSCRWRCEAFASCWTANTPTEGWTTTLQLCPFDWITWRLLFKTCGQNPHLGFLFIFVVRLMWVWGIERLRELHFRRGRAGQQWGLLLDCLPLCPIHRPCGGAVTSAEDK